MEQNGSETFINLFNNVRVGKCTKNNLKQLLLKKINIDRVPPIATLIFAENKPKDDYYAHKLTQFNYFEIRIKTIDELRETMPVHLQTSLSSRSCSPTARLPGTRALITSNPGLKDWLINAQFGIVYNFGLTDSSITKVHLKLDVEKAGKNAILQDSYALKHKVVPIQMVETNIRFVKIHHKYSKNSISIDSCKGIPCSNISRSYTKKDGCFHGVGKTKNILSTSNLCWPFTPNILVKIRYTF